MDQRTSGRVNAHMTPGPGIYFDAFIHVYSARAWQTTAWGRMLMSTESPYHFAHLLQDLKQSLWSLILYTFFFFFFFFHMYIAPAQGQTTHWGQNFDVPWRQNFDVNRKAMSFCPFSVSFKNISLNSDFIHIFNVFPHVYSPGAGEDNPFGSKVDTNRKILLLSPFVASLKKNLF